MTFACDWKFLVQTKPHFGVNFLGTESYFSRSLVACSPVRLLSVKDFPCGGDPGFFPNILRMIDLGLCLVCLLDCPSVCPMVIEKWVKHRKIKLGQNVAHLNSILQKSYQNAINFFLIGRKWVTNLKSLCDTILLI